MVNFIPTPPQNPHSHSHHLHNHPKNPPYTIPGVTNTTKSRRYAVLQCADDSEHIKKMYGGYLGVFVGMLGEEGETWDVFRVACNEFPDDYEVGLYDGFVVTGSCSDAHGCDAWVVRLLGFVNKLVLLKKKLLGVCFGHQILGRALGGKVGRSTTGWDIGLRTINFTTSPSKLFPNINNIPSSLSIIQCHQDEIWELPSKVEVIARSSKTSIEMFRYGDHIMGIQGHPEYNKDILLHLIHRLIHKKIIGENYGNQVGAKFLEAHDPDKEAWRKLCVNFLKGRL